MSASWLLAVGAGWLIGVVLWLYLGPKQFIHLWHATGAKRVGLIIAVYVFTVLYQIVIFGWLVPVGMGLYKLMKKMAI